MAKISFKEVPSGSVAELREYLVYLVDELSWQLRSIDEENMTDEMISLIGRRSENG
ncbi:MAG: hypothetical protein IJT91_05395 [Clostridia bacterium]|nr:hypothetical protein [Clostridia bacterium]